MTFKTKLSPEGLPKAVKFEFNNAEAASACAAFVDQFVQLLNSPGDESWPTLRDMRRAFQALTAIKSSPENLEDFFDPERLVLRSDLTMASVQIEGEKHTVKVKNGSFLEIATLVSECLEEEGLDDFTVKLYGWEDSFDYTFESDNAYKISSQSPNNGFMYFGINAEGRHVHAYSREYISSPIGSWLVPYMDLNEEAPERSVLAPDWVLQP